MAHYADEEMSDPRFVPRRYAVEPELFGRTATIEWRDSPSSDARDRIAAAQMQHAQAHRIRTAAKQQHGSVKKYADAHEINYDRLSKVLRGTAIMRLEDIAQAERLLKLSGGFPNVAAAPPT